MKLHIKCLALAAIVAICLATAPALSAPAGNCSNNGEKFQLMMARNTHPGNDQIGMGHAMMGPGMAKNGFSKEANQNKLWTSRSGKDLKNMTKEMTMKVLKSGTGFATATSGDQYHELKVSIVSTAKFDASKIRDLVSDNKTIAEIKSQIKAEMFAQMDAASHNGTLMLGKGHYKLTNIKTTTTDANTTAIEADVAGPITFANWNKTKTEMPPVVGHITITTGINDGKLAATGTLTMNSGDDSGSYKVLLAMGNGNKGINRFNGQSFGMAGRNQQFNGFGGKMNGMSKGSMKGPSHCAANGSACKAASA